MARHSTPDRSATHAALRQLFADADACVVGASCTCTDAADSEGAFCCHFANIGREPYVTDLELSLLADAIRARGALPRPPRRRLPLEGDRGTCPLLSSVGRCTVYAARPLGCRTFFCQGHEPPDRGRARKELLAIGRRVADLSARAFPRAEGPRPLRRALASLAAGSR